MLGKISVWPVEILIQPEQRAVFLESVGDSKGSDGVGVS